MGEVKLQVTSFKSLLSKLLIVYFRIDVVLACFQDLDTLLFCSVYMSLMLCINLESIFTAVILRQPYFPS